MKELVAGQLSENKLGHVGARDLADRDSGQVEKNSIISFCFIVGQHTWAHDNPIPIALAE